MQSTEMYVSVPPFRCPHFGTSVWALASPALGHFGTGFFGAGCFGAKLIWCNEAFGTILTLDRPRGTISTQFLLYGQHYSDYNSQSPDRTLTLSANDIKYS
uniref:Uncharacterized protein n=1 Tax=Romanomermis culicivorax TaxID=13658 RepID=A0A915IG69_ROMCU